LRGEALLAARLLQGAEVELLPMRSLFEAATRMSIEFDHPAYDCVHLALAVNASLLQQMNAFCGNSIRADNARLVPKRFP
jgi:hypothetical protein